MSEYSRTLRIDTIGSEPRAVAIAADAEEREALAKRFGIASLALLRADAAVGLEGGQVRAKGRVVAAFVQLCVATNVALPATLDIPFDIVFRADIPAEAPDAGIELSETECDIVFYEGGAIDLGEAAAQTLALAIDPYPRALGADAVLKAAGVLSEAQAGPFAALAALKRNDA